MTRRILLIDADPSFRAQLTQLLGRYRFEIVTEPDADAAIALGGAAPPTLLVVSVEEPDKAGFKIFQRCKRGALAKVPIVLVTSSVTPASFAKHRGLKVHADEYLDKRTVSNDELLAKLDALIGLGEPGDDLDAGLEVEVDEIPLSSDDMVLEETVGEDDVEVEAEPAASPGEPAGDVLVDSMVDAETDAAFAALLSDDAFGGLDDGPGEIHAAPEVGGVGEPAILTDDPRSISVRREARNEITSGGGNPGGVTSEPPAPQHGDEPSVVGGVPALLLDSGRPGGDLSGGVDFDSFSRESMRPPVDLIARVRAEHRDHVEAAHGDDIALEVDAPEDVSDVGEAAPDAVEAIDDDAPSTPAPRPHDESLASIPIDVDDIEQLDDDAGVILEVDAGDEVADDDAAAVAAPVPDETAGELAEPPAGDTPTLEHAAVAAPASEPEATPVEHATTPSAPVEPTTVPVRRPGPRPKFLEASTVVESGLQAVANLPPAPVAQPVTPIPDLGLDEIAAGAPSNTEQSGVFDRRSLRKVGELERQIAQLKAELDRARQAADASARGSGREREFLNLREQLIAKDQELHRVRDDLRARDRELAEFQNRLRDAEHARTASDARTSDLEQRVALDAGRMAGFEARDRGYASQISSLQQDLEARSQAAASAEAARVHLERDLAAERALRAAHASDAERALRVEREQLVARHQAELTTVRNEQALAREAAVQALREQLETDHAAALEAAMAAADQAARSEVSSRAEAHASQRDAEHAGEVARLKAEHAVALAELTSERDVAMAQIATERDAAVSAAEDEHHQVIARLQGERAAELAQAQSDAQAQLAHVREQLTAEIDFAKQDADNRVAAITTAKDRAVAELVAELERLKHQLASERAEHEHAIGTAAVAHAAALEEISNRHAEDLIHRQQEHAAARAGDAAAHEGALAELKAELERQAARHGISLDAARKDVDDLIAQHELAKGQLVEQHRAIADELAQRHADELARLHAERAQAIDDAQQAAAAVRAAAEQAAAEHRSELAQHAEMTAREVAEHRSALLGVKRAMEDAAVRHAAERDSHAAAAAKALEDQIAQHERAIAVVHGEVVRTKAVADAEHAKAIASLQADHEHQRKELIGEHERQRREAALDGERVRREQIAEHDRQRKELAAEHARQLADRERQLAELSKERDELRAGLSGARDAAKRSETELAAAVQTIADRNAELRAHAAAIGERDQRITELRGELTGLEHENASYQEQVLRAYQKIKTDEAMVARAKKAMAIALTVLDEPNQRKAEPT